MPILDLQKRARELGRIRTGQKGDRGQPQKLDRFRLTSHSRPLLDKVAALYGGTVHDWTPPGGPQQWEVITDATRLPIMIPPQPVTQWYELWTAGGCVHRCDGATEWITGEPCDNDGDTHQAAKPTTRLNVVLRDVEGIGVWRLESHGWNAAAELPQAAEFLAQAGGYVDGWVALEERVSRSIVDGKPLTRRFLVPVIEIDVTPAQLMAGHGRVAAPALSGGPVTAAALPAPTPDWMVAAAAADSVEELRDVWAQAQNAGQMTDSLAEYIRSQAADLTAAVPLDTAPKAPTPALPDADAVWHQITATAGRLGWTTNQLAGDFRDRMGMVPDEADAVVLQAYLDLITAEAPA